jgi:hypothetical protein
MLRLFNPYICKFSLGQLIYAQILQFCSIALENCPPDCGQKEKFTRPRGRGTDVKKMMGEI